MRFVRRFVVALAVLAMGAAVVPAADAAYYNEYSDIASTPNIGSITAAQGFAAGSTYLYSIKTGGSKSVIYRVNKSSGARVVMKNGTSNASYNTWLGHANDMTIADIGGKHYFFIVTMNSSGAAQVVKLRYDGTTYYKVATYALRYKGAVLAASGISRVSVASNGVNLLFTSQRKAYRGRVALSAKSGTTMNVSAAFTLNVANAKVNGATIPGLSSFLNQGFFYDTARSTLYLPLTSGNRSVVLVYRGVKSTTTGALNATSGLSFRITSSKYSSKFEIEGVGVSGSRLYFNTNRANSQGSYDAVHAFKGYSVS